MKRTKLSALFLTVAFALLLAACSDRMDQGGFATVTIRLGKSEASRQLVGLGDELGTTSETHTYKLIAKKGSSTFGPIDIDIDAATGNLKASGVPTGDCITLEVRAYMTHDNFIEQFDIPDDIFTSDEILRAIGVSDSVNISANQTNNVSIDLYTATEVSSWAELGWAAEGRADSTDSNRKETIILKQTTTDINWWAEKTINIYRPIEIKAEGNVNLIRASDFTGPFFGVEQGTKLAIGATLDGKSIGSNITLDGHDIDDPSLKNPLIIAYGDCTIGKDVTLQNNTNYNDDKDPNSEGLPGGGVFIAGGTFTLYGTIKNNTAHFSGGGVYMAGGSFLMEDGAIIEGNHALNCGGGVYIADGDFTMKAGAIIKGNDNEYGHGGGVFMSYGDATFNMMEGSQIKCNTAASGGGVRMLGGTFNMEGGIIGGNNLSEGNSASNTGGGVYISSGLFKMKGGEIKYNKAGVDDDSGFGGGVYIEGGTFDISAAGTDYIDWVKENFDSDPGGSNVRIDGSNNGSSIIGGPSINGPNGGQEGW